MGVSPIQNINENFLFGMDISSLLVMEKAGFHFHDFDGKEDDLINIIRRAGANTVRVKIWNDPYDENGNGYGGGNSDPESAILIAERAARAGMKMLIDFHYSDFWSDPTRQIAPKAWASFSLDEKASALYDFTTDILEKILNTGADIALVQVGNEINHGIAGEHSYENKCVLLKAGIRAIKDINKKHNVNILSAVHFTDPNKGFEYICEYLKEYNVDYDVFGCSFYSTWHGSSHCLAPSLRHIAENYNKKVMIVETAWPHDMPPAELIYTYGYNDFELSVNGQIEFMRDVVEQLAKIGEPALGISYWEPAWFNTTESEWNIYGTGWASKYAGSYDDEAKGTEGVSGVDEQSLMYVNGHDVYPLESLNIYNMIRGR